MTEYTSDTASEIDFPCVVLIDGNTASAAEVFTGAMQDYDLAEIIGTQSYGKGIVQSIIGLTDGSGVKITVEDYYTPSGNNINGVGITPDEYVEYEVTDEYDTQIEAGMDYIRNNK